MNVQATSDRALSAAELSGVPQTSAGLDFAALIALVRRRWPLVVIITVIVAMAAVAVSLLITPQFDAVARLRISPRNMTTIENNNATNTQPENGIIDSEISIMRSRDIAEAVAKRLNLARDPEFNPMLAKGEAAPAANAPVPDGVVAGVQGRMSVLREPDTYIAQMIFRSESAEKAAAIANVYAEEYLQSSVDRRTGTAGRQAKWLEERLRTLGAEVQAADARVAQYRSQAGIVQGGTQGTITDQQVAPLSNQLATAEAAAAAARANVAAARAQMARGGTEAISQVLGSTVIADLRRQRAELARDGAQISARYGPKHPESIRIAEQLSGVDRQIDAEARRIIGGLEADARASEAGASSLRSQLARLKSEQAGDTRAAVTADSLAREAEAKRTIYNQLAATAQQTNQETRSSEPQGTIVERAAVPARATWPNRILFGLFGVLLGAILGVLAALVLELMSTGIRTVDDVERTLGIPLLTSLPLLTKRRLGGEGGAAMTPADYVVARPMSTYAESLRTIRNEAMFHVDKPKRVISIVSSVPGEGKTTTSAALGRIMAMSGDKVVLVDCDLRRGSLGKTLNQQQDAGLIEVLNGTASLEQALVRTDDDSPDVLPVNEPSFTPRDLFSGPAMQKLLDALQARYDVILLDTPPLLAVAEARTLAGLSDAVVMVIRWEDTPRGAVRNAVNMLLKDRVPLLGAVLSMMSVKAAQGSGSDNPAYYYKYYQNYRQE
ncbi:GumC family protein [Sphingomonas immobilis]|uniref:non-specific protein-tyrosine kinase n=1 Tax=Sphingomonas immobilis TaxID=3063997 RepID=A0ABT9A463_9SPHN|nr:polysaccharide biosynthesis tyrosine autokinase [Sphingomonas sp. CA1-15]MDO7844600.1 polysaccharide biosynthesis tyrosine autokinase [Sphingomonas sp. CA1-15]